MGHLKKCDGFLNRNDISENIKRMINEVGKVNRVRNMKGVSYYGGLSYWKFDLAGLKIITVSMNWRSTYEEDAGGVGKVSNTQQSTFLPQLHR